MYSQCQLYFASQTSTSALLNYTTATCKRGALIRKDPTIASVKTDSLEMEFFAQVVERGRNRKKKRIVRNAKKKRVKKEKDGSK